MRFFWDMDGVLYDFDSLFRQVMPGVDMEDDDAWTWQELHAREPEMYLKGEAMPGIKEVFDFAATKGENCILTAIPRRWNWPNVTKHKREWATKNLLIAHHRVKFGPYAEDKQYHVQYADDVLIDDRIRNINQWEESGGIGILHKSPEETLEKIKSVCDGNWYTSLLQK